MCSRPPSIRSKTRSPARVRLAVFRNGALRIGMRIDVRIESILRWHVRCLCSLRRRDAFAWGEFIDIEPRVLPEPERDWKRINVDLAPPCGLVTLAMKLAVVDPTNRDGELIAHSVSEGARLHKREVMRIRRRSAAYKARLPRYELPMLLIAQANRFA